MPTPAELSHAMRLHALSLPGAWEDFPWGERVAKVGQKVFVFMGHDASEELGFSVKIKVSAPAVLARGYASPTGYGLGKAGWVSVHLQAGGCPSMEEIRAWIDESYRAVAPKRMIAKMGG